ncbi:hypothetical protein Jann_3626 [Jannaschia sp. CCS1]|nr:hypothetical protein [Jannaschia sp. CCS1]ABD56543.1 hypothetical protein Jann_3626 [Jannaschia sp. CCS1]
MAAETFLHRSVRASHVSHMPPCRELFDLSPSEALELLSSLPTAQIRGYDKAARLQTDGELQDLLRSLLWTTGINNFLEQQGIWCLSMFPSTAGGRYYTMNIDRHEVAYASLPRAGAPSVFMFAVDPLISDYKPTRRWLRARAGRVAKGGYRSALERLQCVEFEGGLSDASEFLTLPGVRRALLAYWYDSLVTAIEAGRGSLHAKHHNLACIEELASNFALKRV